MNPPGQTSIASEVARQKQIIAELAQNGQAAKAKELCATLCEKIPDDPETWFLLGAINGLLADFPEAEICCRHAIPLAPQHPMLRFNLGIALLRQDKVTEAIENLEHAIILQSDFADAHLELGNARLLNNEPQLAVKSYLRIIELQPNSHITCFNLGNAYRGLGSWHKAVEYYKQATRLAPIPPPGYYNNRKTTTASS